MNEVTSTEAVNGLSRLLDAALQGQSTKILRNGRPVAILRPPDLSATEVERLESLHPKLCYRRFKAGEMIDLSQQDPDEHFVAVPKHGGWAVMVERKSEASNAEDAA